MAIPQPEPRDWQIANAQELQVTDREVLRMLRLAKKNVDAILANLPTGKQEIKRAQLEQTRATILAEQSKVFERLGDIVEARRALAASRSARLSAAAEAALLRAVGKGAQGQFLYDSALTIGQRAIDTALARMKLSALPLSRRIYNTGVWMNGRLNNLINETLASGVNAKEFAKKARDWFNPNTPGGVRFAAMRLARTEINNAFHAMSAQKYADTPWIDKVDWNLSRSHPKRDICNEVHDLSPYPANAVPVRPHPQCMCYITAQTPDEDEFIDRFISGEFDNWLDAELEKNGWQEKDPTPNPAPSPASKSAGTQAPQPERREEIITPETEITPKASTDGYAPGNWQQHTDNEAKIQEIIDSFRAFNKTATDAELRELATGLVDDTTGDDDVTFRNGPHEVMFTGKLSPEKQQEFLGYVDRMQSKFPANRSLAIRVAPSSEFGWGVGGETTIATGYMRINERTLTEEFWPGMPVSSEVPSALYVLAHEWGHAFPNKEDARNVHVHRDAVKAGGMTKYGTRGGNDEAGHAAEGYAEAFAEWSLTNGRTTNKAALEYAERFNWGERFGNRSN